MRRLKRLLSLCLLPLLAAGLFSFGWAQPADAARGGRIGGGSFRSAPIRSAPMRGGYGGGYRGGYGGGIGFPFLIPFFGFGGGGLFGFLILMALIGVVVNGLRGATGGGGMAAPSLPTQRADGPVTLAQFAVGVHPLIGMTQQRQGGVLQHLLQAGAVAGVGRAGITAQVVLQAAGTGQQTELQLGQGDRAIGALGGQ